MVGHQPPYRVGQEITHLGQEITQGVGQELPPEPVTLMNQSMNLNLCAKQVR